MKTVRIWFRKVGSAKYISHLDLSRCMARALRRGHVPAWYTEGFSPHLFVTFALPLSLGQEGERESMDIRLPEEFDPEQAAKALGDALPPGLEVFGVTEPEMKPGAVESARYRLETEGAGAEALRELLALPELLVTKRTKKGEKTVDLKPWLEQAALSEQENGLLLRVVLPAGTNDSLNPALLGDLIRGKAPECRLRIVREALLCGEKEFL